MKENNLPLTEKEIELARSLSTAKFNEETGEFFRVMGQFAENPNEVKIIEPDEIRRTIGCGFRQFAQYGCG
jgi:hypothetical protein